MAVMATGLAGLLILLAVVCQQVALRKVAMEELHRLTHLKVERQILLVQILTLMAVAMTLVVTAID